MKKSCSQTTTFNRSITTGKSSFHDSESSSGALSSFASFSFLPYRLPTTIPRITGYVLIGLTLGALLWFGIAPLYAAVAAAIGVSLSPAIVLLVARELKAARQFTERTQNLVAIATPHLWPVGFWRQTKCRKPRRFSQSRVDGVAAR